MLLDSGVKHEKQQLHFLHIGKTGGSALKYVLQDFVDTRHYSLQLHRHGVSLKDVPQGQGVIFFLRDPISRFISGFYSRQRKGQPRYYSEWNPYEKKVFEHFSTPNDIALALANRQAPDHALAIMAMRTVQHFVPYRKWYVNPAYFMSRLEDLFFIGFQETLATDFEQLKQRLGLPAELTLPSDAIQAHRNPSDLDKKIDDPGARALKAWYAEDYKFVSICQKIMFQRD